jgi:AcrR family transcriptional regulator
MTLRAPSPRRTGAGPRRARHTPPNSLAPVSASRPASETDVKPDELTAAQARIITAALELFGRHGVGGTSLQMIADEIGVTKAAVYHQYPAKDEIVLAAAEAELARLVAVISVAEAERSARQRRDVVLAGIVDLAIARRGTVGTIMSDPVIVGFFGEHDEFRDVMHRLRRLLIGDDRGPQASIRVAMLIAAISGAVSNPVVAGFDDDVLRAELLRLARRFLGLPS